MFDMLDKSRGVEGNGILVMYILCTHYQGTLITQATTLLHHVYEGWIYTWIPSCS